MAHLLGHPQPEPNLPHTHSSSFSATSRGYQVVCPVPTSFAPPGKPRARNPAAILQGQRSQPLSQHPERYPVLQANSQRPGWGGGGRFLQERGVFALTEYFRPRYKVVFFWYVKYTQGSAWTRHLS